MDARRHAPATARNRDPILEVLVRVLPKSGRLLEVSAGSGEHAVFFASRFPGLSWQPTDLDEDALASIDAWAADARAQGVLNIEPAARLDTTEPFVDSAAFSDGKPAELDAIFCANMIHIAPWECCLGLLDGARDHLKPGAVMVTYGPYKIGGQHTAPSNAAFDESLRGRDPSWGVRDLEEVAREAAMREIDLEETIAMPANNQTVVWRRRSPAGGHADASDET